MKQIFIAIAMVVMVGACSIEQKAALHYAVENVKAGEDSKAQLLKQSACAMTVGSYHRALTSAEKRAIDTLCEK